MSMNVWKRQQKRAEAKRSKEKKQRKLDLASVVKVLGRLIPTFNANFYGAHESIKSLRRAHDVLAGELARLK